MADGIVNTGDTGVGIDNSLPGGSTIYRQRVVIGGDATSSGFINPSTVWPSSGTMGMPVRIIGSSGIVLGSVAQSSNWNISTGAIVGLSTTSTVGLTTTSLVGLSSAIQNYVTNSTTVPVYLGPSSANVIGLVGQSSQWTLAPSSANVIGTVLQSSNWNISTGAVVGLTTTSVVGLSSALSNYITNSTTVPVYLGQSSGNVVGQVAPSSNWALSSGVAYIGVVVSATSGIVGVSTSSILSVGTNTSTGATVLLSTASVVALTSGQLSLGSVAFTSVGSWFPSVALSTFNDEAITSRTTAGALGSSALFVGAGIVASTANTNPTISSGNAQNFQVDRSGALTVNLEGPRQFVKTANLVTAANTSQQQIIAAPGASLVNDIVGFELFSTATSTTITATKITFYSSSGQADPGIWNTWFQYWTPQSTQGVPLFRYFPIPLTQLTANNPWFVVASCSGSPAVNVNVQYVVGTS